MPLRWTFKIGMFYEMLYDTKINSQRVLLNTDSQIEFVIAVYSV